MRSEKGAPMIVPVAEGLGFIEGPMAMADGRIIFTDVGAGRLMAFDPTTNRVASFAETRGGPNAVARGGDGAYYVCNNGGLEFQRTPEGYLVAIPGTTGDRPVAACIQRVAADGKVEALYTECDGRPLVAPNDLVFDDQKGFYFTDTGHPNGRLADLGGLYYARLDGSSVVELVHEAAPHAPLTQPNGCGLSPDGRRIYVAETGNARLWAWDIDAPGRLKPALSGFDASGAKFIYGVADYHMFDSLAVEAGGNICVATIMRGGISVISPDGGLVEFVPLPVYDPFPTNICFAGDDMLSAYITAAGTGILYRATWNRPGLRLNHQD